MANLEDTCQQSNFRALYERDAKALYNYIYYKSGDTGFSEDTVQEAFMRLWKNCAKVPISKAKSYLFTTATNLFLDKAKRKKIQLKFQESKVVREKTIQDPEYLMQEKEYKEKLYSVINSLPEAQRTAFLMNRIDKLKYREIADILGISQKAVEKRIHAALLVIRKEIGNI